MRAFIMAVVALLCICGESTVLHGIEMRGIIPNLSLIIIVSYSLLQGSKRGRILGLWIGLVQEILFFKTIGYYGLIFYYTGHFSGLLSKNLNRDNYILPVTVVVGADVAYCLINYVFQILMSGKLEFVHYLLANILPEICYTGLVTLPVFVLISLLDRGIRAIETFIQSPKKARAK